MAVITEYRFGESMGIPPGVNSHQRGKRDSVQGWTDSSTRRLTRFLYSVDERKLSGQGLALSLTVRDCPPSAADWTSLRRAFFERLRRMGLVRAHWLTEWQRRGVPHMHAAVWFPADWHSETSFLEHDVRDHWLAVSELYRPGPNGQHVARITDAVGWNQYLSKHSVRGLKNYQRSAESIPEGWKKTGRMWGHLGQWSLVAPVKYTVSNHAFWVRRRILQRWRLADARASGDRGRVRSARKMLQCNDRPLSSCRGTSEWSPGGVPYVFSQQTLRYLVSMGHEVTC